jgi:hypothetical protein
MVMLQPCEVRVRDFPTVVGVKGNEVVGAWVWLFWRCRSTGCAVNSDLFGFEQRIDDFDSSIRSQFLR